MQETSHAGDVRSGHLGATLVAAALLALDRLTKGYFMNRFPEGIDRVTSSWISVTAHQNYGIVANLPVPHSVTVAVTLVAVAGIIFLIHRTHPARSAVYRVVALHVLLAGALGNLWDRVAYGYVYDWLLLGGRSVINLADMFIVIGMGWYALDLRSKKEAS